MAKIKSLFIGPKKHHASGDVQVGGLTKYPSTVTATAAGTALTASQIYQYGFFNCVQTSAATDAVVIPAGLDVGTEITVHAESAMEVNISTGETHNNAAATTAVAVAAGSTARYIKVNSTDWIVTLFSIVGAVSAPTPA